MHEECTVDGISTSYNAKTLNIEVCVHLPVLGGMALCWLVDLVFLFTALALVFHAWGLAWVLLAQVFTGTQKCFFASL